MARDEVLVERSGPVTAVIINRPEARNACRVETVKALHDAFTAFEAAEAGYSFGIYAPAAATLTPFARFQASSINQAAFSEWGANSLSLNVAQQTTTSLRTVLGADLAATQLYLRYDGELASGTDNHALTAGLRMSW